MIKRQIEIEMPWHEFTELIIEFNRCLHQIMTVGQNKDLRDVCYSMYQVAEARVKADYEHTQKMKETWSDPQSLQGKAIE